MKTHHKIAAAALLAVLGAAAHAQSTVSLYGLMDLSAGSFKAPGGKAISKVESGAMTTSFIGFAGKEDLGGGLSASFAVESFLLADGGTAGRYNGDNFWARSAFVALTSKDLGTIKLGRNTTPLFVSTLSFNAFGDSFGFSPAIRQTFTSSTVTGDTGWSDSVHYIAPKIGDFSLGLIGAAGEAGGGRNTGYNLGYGSGAFASALTFQKVAKGATVDDTRTWQLGASYDFGVAKLFGQYAKVDNITLKRDFKISGLGVAVPLGGGKVLLQWGHIDGSVTADRTTTTLGYDYNLSKRTDAYVALMSEKVTGLSNGTSYGVGVRHRF